MPQRASELPARWPSGRAYCGSAPSHRLDRSGGQAHDAHDNTIAHNIFVDCKPAAPTGTLVEHNICLGGKWDEIEGKARPIVTFTTNLLDADPRFVDAANGNYQLRDDSPAFALGFKLTPSEKIGLQQTADRRRAPRWPGRALPAESDSRGFGRGLREWRSGLVDSASAPGITLPGAAGTSEFWRRCRFCLDGWASSSTLNG